MKFKVPSYLDAPSSLLAGKSWWILQKNFFYIHWSSNSLEFQSREIQTGLIQCIADCSLGVPELGPKVHTVTVLRLHHNERLFTSSLVTVTISQPRR